VIRRDNPLREAVAEACRSISPTHTHCIVIELAENISMSREQIEYVSPRVEPTTHALSLEMAFLNELSAGTYSRERHVYTGNFLQRIALRRTVPSQDKVSTVVREIDTSTTPRRT
jgi:hypothetical protein